MWRIDVPRTRKITISAMLVAWSPTRSRYFETKSRRIVRLIACGSSVMNESSSRKSWSCIRSMVSSELALEVCSSDDTIDRMHHAAGKGGHARNVDVRLDRRLGRQL